MRTRYANLLIGTVAKCLSAVLSPLLLLRRPKRMTLRLFVDALHLVIFQQSFIRRIIGSFVFLTFYSGVICSNPYLYAQDSLRLPPPGEMVPLSQDFSPSLIRGIKVYLKNPFRFDFIVDTGDSNLEGELLKEESEKLIHYFLTALAIPEEDLWVNLSPHEKNRIIPDKLGQTEMGRDLLAQDYLLKQLTASLTYPKGESGQRFWNQVYQQTFEQFKTTQVSMNTFNKVWIVPEIAVVYEQANPSQGEATAFVVESKLRVMLEEDYLAMTKNKERQTGSSDNRPDQKEEQLRSFSSDMIRKIILPVLERQINESEHFARLRKIYHSFIMAKWYKTNVKQSIINIAYSDRSKIKGIDLNDPQVNKEIYNNYLNAFKKGVYNFIKDEYDPRQKQVHLYKYFSGGAELRGPLDSVLFNKQNFDRIEESFHDKAMLVSTELKLSKEDPLSQRMHARQHGQDRDDRVEELRGIVEVFRSKNEKIQAKKLIINLFLESIKRPLGASGKYHELFSFIVTASLDHLRIPISKEENYIEVLKKNNKQMLFSKEAEELLDVIGVFISSLEAEEQEEVLFTLLNVLNPSSKISYLAHEFFKELLLRFGVQVQGPIERFVEEREMIPLELIEIYKKISSNDLMGVFSETLSNKKYFTRIARRNLSEEISYDQNSMRPERELVLKYFNSVNMHVLDVDMAEKVMNTVNHSNGYLADLYHGTQFQIMEYFSEKARYRLLSRNRMQEEGIPIIGGDFKEDTGFDNISFTKSFEQATSEYADTEDVPYTQRLEDFKKYNDRKIQLYRDPDGKLTQINKQIDKTLKFFSLLSAGEREYLDQNSIPLILGIRNIGEGDRKDYGEYQPEEIRKYDSVHLNEALSHVYTTAGNAKNTVEWLGRFSSKDKVPVIWIEEMHFLKNFICTGFFKDEYIQVPRSVANQFISYSLGLIMERMARLKRDDGLLKPKKGGIDLNADGFKIKTQGQGAKLAFPFDQAMLSAVINADGLVPMVTTVTPITNLFSEFGLNRSGSESQYFENLSPFLGNHKKTPFIH